MAIDNKVKFGLSNFHVAPITSTTEAGVPTYGTPIKVPGSVSISLSKEVAKSIFYADNGAYYSLRNNRGYTGSYELAKVLAVILETIFGQKRSDEGILVENQNDSFLECAIMFEIDGDVKPTRYCLPRVALEKPDINATTVGENKEVQTESLDVTIMPRLDTGDISYRADADTQTETYNSFYQSVPTPTYTQPQAQNEPEEE